MGIKNLQSRSLIEIENGDRKSSIECGNSEIQDRNRMGIEIENQNENSEIVIEIAQESRNRK